VALTHPAVLVRRSVLDLLRVLLLQCSSCMQECVPTLLDALAALCADRDAEVVVDAVRLVAQWAAQGRQLTRPSLLR